MYVRMRITGKTAWVEEGMASNCGWEWESDRVRNDIRKLEIRGNMTEWGPFPELKFYNYGLGLEIKNWLLGLR